MNLNKVTDDVAKKHALIAMNIMLYTKEMPNRQVDHVGTIYDLYEIKPEMLKEMGWDDTCSKEELMKYFPESMYHNAKFFGFSSKESDMFVMKYIYGKVTLTKPSPRNKNRDKAKAEPKEAPAETN